MAPTVGTVGDLFLGDRAEQFCPDTREMARHADVMITMECAHVGVADQANTLARLASLHTHCSLDA